MKLRFRYCFHLNTNFLSFIERSLCYKLVSSLSFVPFKRKRYLNCYMVLQNYSQKLSSSKYIGRELFFENKVVCEHFVSSISFPTRNTRYEYLKIFVVLPYATYAFLSSGRCDNFKYL